VLLDEGCYYCSIRTMYRILESRNEVRERRAQASHPARVRPELVADGPDQVWTWDIERHEAPRCRAEVKDLRRRAVAAAR
jgi:transposase InsO family protein